MAFKKINDTETLQRTANILRRNIIEMIGPVHKGHYGGSLSAAEIVTVLYFNIMNHDPRDPGWKNRDRFILSKGHAAPVQYAALSECDYFSKTEYTGFKSLKGKLQGHPDMHLTPGVEANTGSLGQGLSLGIGMALGLRMDELSSRVYVLLGDGELGEGQIWEAATVAPHYKLDNLIAIVDKNSIQAMGFTKDRVYQGDLSAKWKSFGWEVFEADGHDIESLMKAFNDAFKVNGKPTAIIAETIKGKGVSFTENTAAFHNNGMDQAQYEQAIKEIEERIKA